MGQRVDSHFVDQRYPFWIFLVVFDLVKEEEDAALTRFYFRFVSEIDLSEAISIELPRRALSFHQGPF